MKKIICVLIGMLLLTVCSCFADDLPLLNGTQLNVEALPDYMDDIWVPYVNPRAERQLGHPTPVTKPLLVYTDKRSGLQGIADENGNILMEPQCKYILDHRNRGRRQNVTSFSNYLICSDYASGCDASGYPDNNGVINLDNFEVNYDSIDKFFKWFPGSGFDYLTDYYDGLAITTNESGSFYGYQDQRGNQVIRQIYKGATNFDSGYATVLKKEKWTIIEKDGSFPFKDNTWNTVQQVKGRKFVGQTPSEKWYLFEMPVSSAIIGEPASNNKTSTENTRKVGNCRYPTRLKLGDEIDVINISALVMYNTAGGFRTDKLQPYRGSKTPAKLTDGPQCVDGIVWWEVNFLGHMGWVTEMRSDGTYLMEKH